MSGPDNRGRGRGGFDRGGMSRGGRGGGRGGMGAGERGGFNKPGGKFLSITMDSVLKKIQSVFRKL